MPFIELSGDDQQTLLSLARESIRVRLLFDRDLSIDETAFSPALRQLAASFVTLKIRGKLRGCIGALEARQSLVVDVVHHAAAAAVDDPRFPPLSLDEEAEIVLDISVLTAPTPLTFNTEPQLLEQLRIGEDGLIIEAGSHRATFLPSVWASLPDKQQFLDQLKLKAGMPPTIAPDKLKAWRYQTVSFGE
ncbi:AmmeMemoRadiSam system protein A [Porticoccus sp.]